MKSVGFFPLLLLPSTSSLVPTWNTARNVSPSPGSMLTARKINQDEGFTHAGIDDLNIHSSLLSFIQSPPMPLPLQINPSVSSARSPATRQQQKCDRKHALDNDSFTQPQPHDVLPNDRGDFWDLNYRKLKSFYDKHGNVRIPVPRSSKPTPSAKLYDWCQEQRRLSLALQMDDGRVLRLIQIGFYNDLVQAKHSWNDWFLQLLHFYINNAHSNVPPSVHYLLLAQWVHQQRRYSHHLCEEKQRLLWTVNFLWSEEEADFEIQYQRMKQFEQQTGVMAIKQCQSGSSKLPQPRTTQFQQPCPQLTVRQWKKLQQRMIRP